MIKVIRSFSEMSAFSRRSRERGQRIGFVPTMGALHDGHLALVQEARQKCDLVVVSIFVNPIQFAPGEDYEKYPRTLAHDKELLKHFSPLVIFHPRANDMFPADFKTHVKVDELGDRLCGRYRPSHFKGVTTVVAKLLNIVMPDSIFLGAKDFQQQLIIRQMIRDLNYAVEVHTVQTVREYDGLAMSSRNAYLKENERKSAGGVYKVISRAKKMIKEGDQDLRKIHLMISRQLGMIPSLRMEYIAIVDPETLQDKKDTKLPILIAVAGKIGKTRLIDNVLIT
ncbi:MAG: pantoate--beta-alanine ligase [Candidatus Margulisbacteria bacterium]|nr:pantoate--beta-alanine ligase [Candidatus Margulisiibacteriota bacterium]